MPHMGKCRGAIRTISHLALYSALIPANPFHTRHKSYPTVTLNTVITRISDAVLPSFMLLTEPPNPPHPRSCSRPRGLAWKARLAQRITPSVSLPWLAHGWNSAYGDCGALRPFRSTQPYLPPLWGRPKSQFRSYCYPSLSFSTRRPCGLSIPDVNKTPPPRPH